MKSTPTNNTLNHDAVGDVIADHDRTKQGYFYFITHPEIQPTNNSAEQALRFVVMDRHMTQGTRSQRGRDFCERLWTVIATCSLQNRSAYVWIHAAIRAHFNGRPVPSLLLDSC